MRDREAEAPRFAIREGYALYRGLVTDGSSHAHAAFQIAIAVRGEVAMVDSAGSRHRAEALVVPPMVRHRILASPDLLIFFVEPHCAFADGLRERYGPGVTAAPELHGLTEDGIGGTHPSRELDGRLLEAMDALAGGAIAMPEVAALVGLSPQRLRALAREQLGMPLARWRIWRRLVRAAEALREGRSLAEAPIAGGFADQAHFTRQMRDMMGSTPSSVLPILRPSAAPRDEHRDRPGDR
ncbi:AraC family transcriptional regulator [Actinocorallia herbida]|uniref:AraC family transcriptional regulator n=1 Tax=Actinocorallia herbida TaxID=58109 RepID=A0A3N1D4B3_9ACTN|nr:AraC family transcriptional regulator [Actinocorallia herbida]ROO88316.1 AraC family transcriptional regulator [Actinocorallia herbida]